MPVPAEILHGFAANLSDTKGRSFLIDLNKRDLIPNKIPGREGHMMDAQAYREFGESRNNVFNLIRFMRLGYSPQPLNLGELNELACGIYELPVYLALRAENQMDIDRVPPSLLDASRAVAAVISTTERMMRIDHMLGSEVKTPEEVYDYASGNNLGNENLFLGKGGRSCPAKDETIEVLSALINFPTQEIKPSDEWKDYLAPGDIDQALRFGGAYYYWDHILPMYIKLPQDHPERPKYKSVLLELKGYVDDVLDRNSSVVQST